MATCGWWLPCWTAKLEKKEVEEWNLFLILWLWQLEGSWDSQWEKKVPGLVSFFTAPCPQVMTKEQCTLTLSLQVEELGLGDRRTLALTVIRLHLDLFFHVVFGLGRVSTGPLTQAGTLNVNGNSGDANCASHTRVPSSLCALQCPPLGQVQRGPQSTCWRIGHFRGGGNDWSR